MAGHSDTHCLLNHPETQGIADVLLLNDRQSVFDVINHYLAAGHKNRLSFRSTVGSHCERTTVWCASCYGKQ